VAHDVLDALGRFSEIDRDDDSSQTKGGEISDVPLGAVRREDGHAIPFAHAELRQGLG
jgi:hypothetical protein